MTTPRIAYIHVGTHKTGTTSIQAMLGANAELLARRGILIPNAGRLVPAAAGHHNIAWELVNSHRFDPNRGTLAALSAEIAHAGLPTVCVSSEEFESLAGDIAALRRFHAAFRALGYEPRAIVYLRPQADYLESLYAELVRGGWPTPFEDFRSTIVRTGKYVQTDFDYARLVATFADVFGSAALRVRPYNADAPSDALLAEFLAIIGDAADPIDFGTIERPGRLNRQAGFDEVLAARFARTTALPAPVGASGDDDRFAPLTLLDIAELAVCFAPVNARIERDYGVRVAPASWATVAREIVTALTGDRAARTRQRLIRASGHTV